ncbi:MAG TPA: GtrA family protein [Acidimicrobiia bacterium]
MQHDATIDTPATPSLATFSMATPSAVASATVAPATTAPPTTLITRLTRCMGVSVITTIVSVTMLAAATVGLGLAAWMANVLATAVATVPSYHLNRRWTWGRRDASDMWREILPFWVLAFAGLVLSTLAVALTDSWLHGAHLGQPLHTFVIVAAHLSGFGILWVAQFVLLERVLFTGRDAASDGG